MLKTKSQQRRGRLSIINYVIGLVLFISLALLVIAVCENVLDEWIPQNKYFFVETGR